MILYRALQTLERSIDTLSIDGFHLKVKKNNNFDEIITLKRYEYRSLLK